MSDSKVEIKIPEQMVSDLVRAELAKHLGQSEQLIDSVIKAAFAAKRRDAYSSDKSIFEEEVAEMIRQEGTKLFKEWLEENRAKLRAAFVRALKAGGFEKIVDSLVKGLEQSQYSFHISVPKNGY